jgi:hypothetical protein
MRPELPPTAEGDLDRTPWSHVLVYAVDQRLTGALFLTEPDGVVHVVRFARGVPVKVRPGDGHARLGALLIEEGVIDAADLDAALAAKGLLGEVLVLAGRIDPARLDRVLERQFATRMKRFFALPPATQFAYYDGSSALVDWGGEASALDPLAIVWSGLREHGERSTRLAETLERLADVPLVIHPQAQLDRFGFDEPERAAVDVIAAKPVCLSEVSGWDLVTPPVLSSLVYALTITRQLDLGTGAPVGCDAAMRTEVSTPTGLSLGRLQLRPAVVHRLGAAAPDPPGDGERAPVMASSRRRRTPRTGSWPDTGEPPPSSHRRDIDAELESGPVPPSSGRQPVSVAPAARDPFVEVPAAPFTARSHGASISAAPAAELVAPEDPGNAPELFEQAVILVGERDFAGAARACTSAIGLEPRHPDYLALSVWIRSLQPGGDLKALAVELDELLQRHAGHVPARYYRAMLRRKLSDDAGAIRDLGRVLELAPHHGDAARELRGLEAKHAPAPGLLARIFKR